MEKIFNLVLSQSFISFLEFKASNSKVGSDVQEHLFNLSRLLHASNVHLDNFCNYVDGNVHPVDLQEIYDEWKNRLESISDEIPPEPILDHSQEEKEALQRDSD
jgi:hypothetical protein